MGSEFGGTFIRLRRTKTGLNQSVRVRDPAVCALVERMVVAARKRRSTYLWSFTRNQYYRAFKAVWFNLQLSSNYATWRSDSHVGNAY